MIPSNPPKPAIRSVRMTRAERSDETVGAVADAGVSDPFAASMQDQDRTLCWRGRKSYATIRSVALWVVVVPNKEAGDGGFPVRRVVALEGRWIG